MNIFKKLYNKKILKGIDTSSNKTNDIIMESDMHSDETYWDAGRLIDAIARIAQASNFGLMILNTEDKTNPQFVKIQRIKSVLTAYGKHMPLPVRDKIRIIPSRLLSKKISIKKRKEIKLLMNEIIPCQNFTMKFYNSSFSYFFSEIFTLYVNLKNIDNPFAGVFECSHGAFKQLQYVQSMIETNLVPFENKIKALLILLMGDDYDRTLIVDDLVKNYDYPDITDDNLRQMEIDWEVG